MRTKESSYALKGSAVRNVMFYGLENLSQTREAVRAPGSSLIDGVNLYLSLNYTKVSLYAEISCTLLPNFLPKLLGTT